MKRVYLSCLLLLFAVSQLLAQTYKVVYEYDHAGNRISRTVITMNAQAKSMDAECFSFRARTGQMSDTCFSKSDKRFFEYENICR